MDNVCGTAPATPGAPAYKLNIFVYAGTSLGLTACRLANVAAAKAGVGMFTVLTLGSTKRRPSVSKKKKVLFLRIGPPIEPAH